MLLVKQFLASKQPIMFVKSSRQLSGQMAFFLFARLVTLVATSESVTRMTRPKTPFPICSLCVGSVFFWSLV